ncbi:MAG: RNA-binding transcriptional accessory protein, partial [Clostridia bacterium]|nr:RNA-binding transcriptional accessory protein [Clostridia bacterium]
MDIMQILCREFNLKPSQCENVLRLIDEGNTIPFIARYRKEQTGSLDDQVLREIFERLQYLRGLEKRRGEIESALSEQGNLTEELALKLANAATMTELEDIYRPFRPKRRTRATIAREKGLEPLALLMLMQNERKANAEELAMPYISEEKGVSNVEEALQGARDIISEQVSDDADARKALRAHVMRTGILESRNAKDEDSVYSMYY